MDQDEQLPTALHDKISSWLTRNGFEIIQPDRIVGGAGVGVFVKTHRPSHLTRGPYAVRVAEDAVYEMHINDDGVRGLLYQPWVCVGTHPYTSLEQLRFILTRLQSKPTCWDNENQNDAQRPTTARDWTGLMPRASVGPAVSCCPFCKSYEVSTNLMLWNAVSQEDASNTPVLVENECRSCTRSFWT